MQIAFSPIRSDETLAVEKQGDTLIINGQSFDFSPLPDGATLPAEAIDSPHFAGPVERIGGELHIVLRLPHGPNAGEALRFPEPIEMMGDGQVPIPQDPEPEPPAFTGLGVAEEAAE
ncbi:hypothetical protein [Azotobacter vinelandii]|uniref:hypothetical protein n=1 Tax=Azotobacter vinelandii TaxID=354 RepID=UPI0026671533|nr:hypothetical protein [Azotobacter vinelandii]WKN20790.1 hypothetical protein AVAEIV_003815 [Azotobacter vinelandii]